MPIPDYQTIMLPLLQLLADKKDYIFKDVVTILGKQLKLTEQELSELLPSGQLLLFANVQTLLLTTVISRISRQPLLLSVVAAG